MATTFETGHDTTGAGSGPGAPCRAEDVLGRDYDHYDPGFALNPHETYATLRAQCPVAHSDRYGGFYVISRYEDICEVLHRPEDFSSFPADTPPSPSHTRPIPPFEVDPPDHRSYRRILDPLFGPKRMNLLEPTIRAQARDLVDDMVRRREFDFIDAFAKPFPSSVFLSLIGLEVDTVQRDQLCEWAESILHTSGANSGDTEARTETRVAAARALRAFLSGALDINRDKPDTLLGALFAARFADERELSYEEVFDFAFLLVLGGLDTLTTALGFSFLHLARRPDLQDRLATHPEDIPKAIEELLRFESAVHPSRTVTNACDIGGVRLQPGDRVVLPYASASRDGAVFEHPDEIDLDRTSNRHVAFGVGPHRCLGSHLARLEMRVAFEEIFRRIPRFSVPEDAVLHAHGGQTRSLANLPFRTWRED